MVKALWVIENDVCHLCITLGGENVLRKPDLGNGFNVPARITLEKCYPRNMQNLDRGKKQQWEKKLAKNVVEMGGRAM